MDDNAQPMTDADVATSARFEPAEPLKNQGVEFSPDTGMSGGGGIGTGATAGSGGEGQAATEQVKAGAQKLTAQASDKARQFAEQGRDRAADALGQLVQMLNDAAGQVDDKIGAQYGQYARQAAGTVSGFADQVRGKDVDELFDDVRELVRKSPAVAIGAAAAVGFVLTRLVSAGLDQRDQA